MLCQFDFTLFENTFLPIFNLHNATHPFFQLTVSKNFKLLELPLTQGKESRTRHSVLGVLLSCGLWTIPHKICLENQKINFYFLNFCYRHADTFLKLIETLGIVVVFTVPILTDKLTISSERIFSLTIPTYLNTYNVACETNQKIWWYFSLEYYILLAKNKISAPQPTLIEQVNSETQTGALYKC